jgi:hypothetical protein
MVLFPDIDWGLNKIDPEHSISTIKENEGENIAWSQDER